MIQKHNPKNRAETRGHTQARNTRTCTQGKLSILHNDAINFQKPGSQLWPVCSLALVSELPLVEQRSNNRWTCYRWKHVLAITFPSWNNRTELVCGNWRVTRKWGRKWPACKTFIKMAGLKTGQIDDSYLFTTFHFTGKFKHSSCYGNWFSLCFILRKINIFIYFDILSG